MLKFLSNMVKVKADQTVNAGIEALVRWDPKGASEAELRTMEQRLDELGREVAAARGAYDKERKEYEAIQRLSDQRMAAAEELQKQANAAADSERRDGLEKSLGTLVTMLEQMAPEITREKTEAEDAKGFLEMLEQAYNEAGAKLKEGRATLAKAQRDMARAAQQREMAERQAEAARRAAGLAAQTSGLTVALRSMQEAARKDMEAADAAASKARLLRPTAPEKDDPNISAALAAAEGRRLLPAPDLAGRLAALKAAQKA
jgi:chromosome segregation ATPase